MEASFMWAGVWTGATVGAVLMIPLFMEFCKRNLPIFFGLVMCLLTLHLLAPASPELRAVWFPISQIPAQMLISLSTFVTKLVP